MKHIVGCEFHAEDGTCFGKDLREKYFLLAEGFYNLNHGSFGTVPRPVSLRQHEYFLEQEAYPDTWFRKSYYDYIDKSRELVAGLIHARVDDVVLVENASNAVNSILRSMGLSRGDKVLRLSTAYGMVVETLDWLAETAGIVVLVVEVTFPIEGPAQIIEAVSTAVEQNPDIKICIFSHISSMPALILPIESLISVVRSYTPDSKVLIDGAHAPGVLSIDMSSMDVDFYLGNCHKWMYAPKGTAFLWVSPGQQQDSFPEPTVISSSGYHDFVGRYAYTGTRDYTAFTTLPAAFEFRSFLGGDGNIYAYCHGLAVEAGRQLSAAWGTGLLVPEDMSGYMINVVLPSTDADAVEYMQQQLNSTYNIYLVYSSVTTTITTSASAFHPITQTSGKESQQHNASISAAVHTAPRTSIFFARLSAQVYLELGDFEQLSNLVPQLLAEAPSSVTTSG